MSGTRHDRAVRWPMARTYRVSAGFEPDAKPACRPFESAELDVGDEFFRHRRRLHAVIAIQQVPERLVDAQRTGHVALLRMDAHEMAAGLFVGRIEIGDGGCDFGFDVGGNVLRDQTGTEASHQPVMDGLTFRKYPDPE